MQPSSPTQYHRMSPEAQIALITRLAEFITVSLPRLVSARRFGQELIAIFHDGLDILSHFPKAVTFYLECSRLKVDFERHTERMRFLMEKIIARDLSRELPSVGEAIILPPSQSLRRGRPTADESARRAQDRLTQQRAEAISALTGRRIIAQEASPIDTSRPTDTSRRKQDPSPTLFDALIDQSPTIPTTSNVVLSSSAAQVQHATPAASSSAASNEPDLPTLRSWLFLLPDPLTSQVKSLKDLRARRAAASEHAKSLCIEGAPESEISQFTQQAVTINKQIRDIFDAIDHHLAIAYVMLTEVNQDHGKWAAKYEKRGGIQALISDLHPYYAKVTATATVPEGSPSGSQNDTVHASLLKSAQSIHAATIRDPDKEKELHKIYSYFKRKDCVSTPERLEKLTRYLSRAEELNADPDTLTTYRLIIDKVKSDIN